MEGLTASEIAGFGVGTLLLVSTVAAPKLDALFSSSQRRNSVQRFAMSGKEPLVGVKKLTTFFPSAANYVSESQLTEIFQSMSCLTEISSVAEPSLKVAENYLPS